MTNNHFAGSHAVIIVYAIDSVQSMKSVDEYCGDIEQRCHENVLKFLVGNKSDLDGSRKVFWEDLEAKGELYNINNIFETSAIREKSETIQQLFNEVIRELAEKAPAVGARQSLRLSKRQMPVSDPPAGEKQE